MFNLRTLAQFGLLFWAATAQAAVPGVCINAGGSSEISACISEHAAAAERELSRAYQALLKRIADSDSQLVDRSTVRRRLEEAQRSWLEFRRQDCEGINRYFESSASRNDRLQVCLIERTERRIVELKDWDKT